MSTEFGRRLFIFTALAIGALCFWLLTKSIRGGYSWGSVGLVLITSPVIMAGTWLLVQRGEPSLAGVTLANISYSATFGDLFALTTAVWLLAKGWREYEYMVDEFWISGVWQWISLLLGFILGIAFHAKGGRADSQSASIGERLHDSATSWMHNYGIFTALGGALICTAVPLLVTSATRQWGLWALICLGAWLALAMIDGYRMTLPESWWWCNGHWLDVPMDWAHWRPKPQ